MKMQWTIKIPPELILPSLRTQIDMAFEHEIADFRVAPIMTVFAEKTKVDWVYYLNFEYTKKNDDGIYVADVINIPIVYSSELNAMSQQMAYQQFMNCLHDEFFIQIMTDLNHFGVPGLSITPVEPKGKRTHQFIPFVN